ncbi:MAG: hypothetical protein N2234_05895, partial [Planctomycetota bacterium]|nr:hypothetical protein [Planctomycetota bacterium]
GAQDKGGGREAERGGGAAQQKEPTGTQSGTRSLGRESSSTSEEGEKEQGQTEPKGGGVRFKGAERLIEETQEIVRDAAEKAMSQEALLVLFFRIRAQILKGEVKEAQEELQKYLLQIPNDFRVQFKSLFEKIGDR